MSTRNGHCAPVVIIRTFLNLCPAILLVRLDLIPKDHPQLTVFQCSGDVNFPFFLQLLNRLWGFLPTLLQRTNGEAAAFPCLPLDLSKERSLVSYIEVKLPGRRQTSQKEELKAKE